MRREANFQAGSELAKPLGRSTQMFGCDTREKGITAKVKAFALTAAEDRAASRPNIRGKARTMDRITQR